MPVAVVFLLRTVVLILLWGFVIATVVAVRHDVFGVRPAKQRPSKVRPPRPEKPAKAVKAPRRPPTKTAVPPTRVAVVDGPLAGTSVALSSLPITIGRAEDSTIVINDDYVSHRHARLVPRGTTWLIEDLGSTNGTLLDGKKLTTPTEVRSGSQIRIGKAVL
ncbi:MAG TPA: FHA domain-containing protein, partial [Mycobacteriales bacterium]|nr:FHA domain-containing protein [Mycobacteriales bacterium]